MSIFPPQFALILRPETARNGSWRATSAEGRPTFVELNQDGSHFDTTAATKFEFVPSTSGEVDHFHIKCCLNKKYLRRESQSSNLIVAEADEPIEEVYLWSTTVFQAIPNLATQSFVLGLVGVRNQVFSATFDVNRRLSVVRWGQPTPSSTNFRLVSWETLVVLPRDVIFKGDNGQYLRWDQNNHFQFAATDPADPSAAHTIHQRFDGAITISNNQSGHFLRVSEDDVFTAGASESTHFDPVRIDGNRIAFRSNIPTEIVGRFLQINGNGNQLLAPRSTTQIIREARITVQEQVLSREIFNVVYRIPEAMIRDQENIMVATGQVFNASDAPNQVDMRLAYSLQTTSSWNSRIAGEFGIRSKVTAGIPFLKIFRLQAEYEISANISGEYEWGETVEETTEIETGYAVEAPPRSTMTISITASKATSDIPFSYSQRDTKLDGVIVTTRMHDGLYTGANCYDFQYQAIPSAIETKSLPPSLPLTMKSSNASRPNPKGPSAKL